MQKPDPNAAHLAFLKVAGALEWLSEAKVSAVEPNGTAAYLRRMRHARDRLLEALAVIDGRPAALLPVQLPPRVGVGS